MAKLKGDFLEDNYIIKDEIENLIEDLFEYAKKREGLTLEDNIYLPHYITSPILVNKITNYMILMQDYLIDYSLQEDWDVPLTTNKMKKFLEEVDANIEMALGYLQDEADQINEWQDTRNVA